MSHHSRITIEPGKRGGKPCIRHMRITVFDVLNMLANDTWLNDFNSPQVVESKPLLIKNGQATIHINMLECISLANEGFKMQPQLKHMLEKLAHLAPDRLAEVDDFIDFLQQRDQCKHLREDYAKASDAAFEKVWNNEEDAIYDNL